MVGVLGRFGKHGRTTLYVEDVETFYLDEDIPRGYERREAPVSLSPPLYSAVRSLYPTGMLHMSSVLHLRKLSRSQ